MRDDKRFCHCCGKEFAMNGDMFMEEFLHIEKDWGYFSDQDGMNLSFDVCEKCLMDWIKDFKHKPALQERIEL